MADPAKREVGQLRSQTGDFASAIKRNTDYVYFIRQGSCKVLRFWIEMANLTFKSQQATRSLGSHDLGASANNRQIP